MILRRITKHVKDQNWFAVALDFLIVVVGVGVAMLGQQWISDRQQRADMGVAERALQTDLVLNYSSATERLAVADCRTETYQAIATQLLLPGELWGWCTGQEKRRNFSVGFAKHSSITLAALGLARLGCRTHSWNIQSNGQ